MGYYTTAYVAYGVQIPINPYHRNEQGDCASDQVDDALSVPTVKEACPDVGHLTAGNVDQDSFFLVTGFHEAGYEAQSLGTLPRAEEVGWDRQIHHLIEVMGWGGLIDGAYDPGWFVVADQS